MGALERLNKLIRSGEIILLDARNLEFCHCESIWEASIHEKESEALSDKWNREVLNFLDDEFGITSAICSNFRVQIRACYTLEDEIENIESCLAILHCERRHLRSQKSIAVHTDNT
jgi:hypothetical protein